ncbi:MAG TPA: acetyl-CoA carboxylase biotin carboxyl carrier protein [Burkholderiales bacterium]|nr:acetyl-CoA carboxylase biotin carboxyl carrier protein [Burkholderiales bacterium]
MRKESLTYEDVLRIVELVKSTRFSEFRLKVGEIEVHLRRRNGASGAASGLQVAAESAAIAPSPSGVPGRTFAPDARLVRSPMVGTFYRAPGPGTEPFIEVGRHVEPDTTVCIIEVMKLMNSIAAETRGVVTEILVANGARVEYGEALMVIGPDPEDG